MSRPPLDPRWEWINVGTLENPDQWIKGRCLHIDPTPVHSLLGEKVAYLCLTCDAQFYKEEDS